MVTSFRVSLDLTKRRYSLLAKTKIIIKDNSAVMFDFADINCLLALKLNDSKVHYFIVKVKLIKFYENVSLYSVTTRFIPYDLCLVVVAMWQ